MNTRRIKLLGVPVDGLTTAEALAQIAHFMAEPGLHQLATVNPEFIMTAQKDPAFLAVLNQADLCLPDGVGVLWGSTWRGRPVPERIAGSDMVYWLAEMCAKNGWPLFLLGAAEGVAEEAGAILCGRYPGLQIAGCYAGSPAEAENEAIVQRINRSQASMLYVAYGAPQQDKWIARNRHNLPYVRVALGVGGSLDFITGRVPRAPRWCQKVGVEWLYRLWQEPWRWRRMLALPRFVWAVVKNKDEG
jgi:N-acetylglucosaminyldiphosphoundecaprenol N-acetyl-beta-D-mannosaminyltransferase